MRYVEAAMSSGPLTCSTMLTLRLEATAWYTAGRLMARPEVDTRADCWNAACATSSASTLSSGLSSRAAAASAARMAAAAPETCCAALARCRLAMVSPAVRHDDKSITRPQLHTVCWAFRQMLLS